MSQDIKVVQVDGGRHAPEEIRRLAERLSIAQGAQVRLTSERSGFHIYLPCPACLETHGSRETRDPKYAINATKWMLAKTGDMPIASVSSMMQAEGDRIGICMRTRQSRSPHFFSLSELEHMGTVSERFPDIDTRARLVDSSSPDERESYWLPDPRTGKLCPPPAGEVIAITSLPEDHPAIEFVRARGFTPEGLWRQFRAGFCETQFPEDKERRIFYPRFPGGWRDTPQHRLIFHALVDGVPLSWQARVIEKSTDHEKLMLHPYAKPFEWSAVSSRTNLASPWIPQGAFAEVDQDGDIRFNPSKYRTAKHSIRQPMGWDAAVNDSVFAGAIEDVKIAVLTEGPFDAARVGPGGLAVMGASMSHEWAQRIAETFHLVLLAFDNDKVGQQANEKLPAMLYAAASNSRVPLLQMVEIVAADSSGKDLGDMSQDAWNTQISATLRNLRRRF